MDVGAPRQLMARSLDELNVLANMLMRQGLQKFVLESITPLNRAVGEAWMRGELQVFEEHLYTEQLQVAMRTAINAFPRQTGIPRVMLTTFPNEQHGIGLDGPARLNAHLHFTAWPSTACRRRCGRPPMPSTIPPPIRRSHPSRPSSSTSASAGSTHRHRRCSPVCDTGLARTCPPPAGPRTTTLASAPAPARTCHHKRAEQPVATDHPRLTRATGSSALRLVRLKCLSV
jgi:hypothetical protein